MSNYQIRLLNQEWNEAMLSILIESPITTDRMTYRQLGYHFMIWGSSVDDPLLKAAKGFMRQQIISNIVLFLTDERWLTEGMVKNKLPYIDLSAI